MKTYRSLAEKLGRWEAVKDTPARLTTTQKGTATSLAYNRPFPQALPLDDNVLSDSPVSEVYDTTEFIPYISSQKNMEALQHGFNMMFAINQPKIENAQEFFAWFACIDEMATGEDQQDIKKTLENLSQYHDECNSLLNDVTAASNYLRQLNKQYLFVSTKTSTLHNACEELLMEQSKLMEMAESICNKLVYFNDLDRISQKLSSSTFSVTSESFVPLLTKLDECVAYMSLNFQYKESDMYLMKLKQCLWKALNLIKSYTINSLQNATQQVLPKKQNGETFENAFTLFYGKFRTHAPRIKALMEQIEERIYISPEYLQLLEGCHICYFTQREILLMPSITSAINDLAAQHLRDHCSLVRSSCAFIVHVCQDEFQLYHHFFGKPTKKLEDLLETVSLSLYDVLRPLIININHLETLSELCSILKIEMLEDHVQNNADELAAFEIICKQLLEDVLERLVFRTDIYIKSDILNYKPGAGDLAYPEKLEMMQCIALSLNREQKKHSRSSSVDSAMSLEVSNIMSSSLSSSDANNDEDDCHISPADMHGMWYPTVRRTLVCLSKIYRCIDRSIFEGLSQEALCMCVQSLLYASQQISKKKTALDGELFLIKHLLILREQIAPFHSEFTVRETGLDFSQFKSAAYHLLFSRDKIFSIGTNNAVLEFLLHGGPHVTEYYVDSKKEVDNNLKMVCEKFILSVTEVLVKPLHEFNNRATVILQLKKDGETNITLRHQPFANPEKIQEVLSLTYRQIKSILPTILKSMSIYLSNKDTEYILFKPIKINVLKQYQTLQQMLLENYVDEDIQIIGCPTTEEVNILVAGPK